MDIDDEKREPSGDEAMASSMSECSSQEMDDFMFLCCVYGIYPKSNIFGKCLYVKGTTNLGRRIGDHRSATTNKCHPHHHSDLYNYIRKHGGMEKFRVRILEEHLYMDNESLHKREMFHINRQCPKFPNGFDSNQGAVPTAVRRFNFMECKQN